MVSAYGELQHTESYDEEKPQQAAAVHIIVTQGTNREGWLCFCRHAAPVGLVARVCYNRSAKAHVKRLRPFSAPFSRRISRRFAWRGLLAFFRRWRQVSRCGGAGGGREHRTWRCGNRARDGRTVRATGVCAHLAISFGASREACGATFGAGSAKLQKWRARLFYFRRIGSDRNGDQARSAISSRKRAGETLPCDFAAAELSR